MSLGNAAKYKINFLLLAWGQEAQSEGHLWNFKPRFRKSQGGILEIILIPARIRYPEKTMTLNLKQGQGDRVKAFALPKTDPCFLFQQSMHAWSSGNHQELAKHLLGVTPSISG